MRLPAAIPVLTLGTAATAWTLASGMFDMALISLCTALYIALER